jgi:hypothetical protein
MGDVTLFHRVFEKCQFSNTLWKSVTSHIETLKHYFGCDCHLICLTELNIEAVRVV